MNAGELCTGDVVIARPEWSAIEAAQRMSEYDVGNVVVIEDDGFGGIVPVGLLTDRDLVVEVLAKDPAQWHQATIGSVMTCELLTAHSNEDISSVIARMRKHGVRRMPVVGDRGGLEGIISYDDIVEWLSEQMVDLATVARAAKSSVL
jgi:CBS domain-containing protein